MIVIQTNRIFLIQEVQNINNNPVKVEQKKDVPIYTRKVVKYIIPEFYI
jgi:hypothetical protein